MNEQPQPQNAKAPKPAPIVIAPPTKAEAMPVKLLRFKQPTDVPGDEASVGIKSGGEVNRNRWEITYLPWMRHHFVVFYPSVGTPKVGYVHEGAVSCWEPIQ